MASLELWLYKISVQWRQQVREQIFQDESKLVGYRNVSSIAYIVAPGEELAVTYLKDRLQWSSENKKIAIMSVTQLPIYGIVSAGGMQRLDETMED